MEEGERQEGWRDEGRFIRNGLCRAQGTSRALRASEGAQGSERPQGLVPLLQSTERNPGCPEVPSIYSFVAHDLRIPTALMLFRTHFISSVLSSPLFARI